MSKRTQRRHLAGGSGVFLLSLGLLAVFFLAGMLWGKVSAQKNPDDISVELYQYLLDYCALETGEEGHGWTFLSALLVYFRYPLIAFFLGFVLQGTPLLLLISAAFGFFLSYAVCCFAGAFGKTGLLMAIAVFGLRSLITIPCFLVLAAPAIQRAASLVSAKFFDRGKRLRMQPGLEWWLVMCIVSAVLLAGALLEVFLTPILLEKVLQDNMSLLN